MRAVAAATDPPSLSPRAAVLLRHPSSSSHAAAASRLRKYAQEPLSPSPHVVSFRRSTKAAAPLTAVVAASVEPKAAEARDGLLSSSRSPATPSSLAAEHITPRLTLNSFLPASTAQSSPDHGEGLSMSQVQSPRLRPGLLLADDDGGAGHSRSVSPAADSVSIVSGAVAAAVARHNALLAAELASSFAEAEVAVATTAGTPLRPDSASLHGRSVFLESATCSILDRGNSNGPATVSLDFSADPSAPNSGRSGAATVFSDFSAIGQQIATEQASEAVLLTQRRPQGAKWKSSSRRRAVPLSEVHRWLMNRAPAEEDEKLSATAVDVAVKLGRVLLSPPSPPPIPAWRPRGQSALASEEPVLLVLPTAAQRARHASLVVVPPLVLPSAVLPHSAYPSESTRVLSGSSINESSSFDSARTVFGSMVSSANSLSSGRSSRKATSSAQQWSPPSDPVRPWPIPSAVVGELPPLGLSSTKRATRVLAPSGPRPPVVTSAARSVRELRALFEPFVTNARQGLSLRDYAEFKLARVEDRGTEATLKVPQATVLARMQFDTRLAASALSRRRESLPRLTARSTVAGEFNPWLSEDYLPLLDLSSTHRPSRGEVDCMRRSFAQAREAALSAAGRAMRARHAARGRLGGFSALPPTGPPLTRPPPSRRGAIVSGQGVLLALSAAGTDLRRPPPLLLAAAPTAVARPVESSSHRSSSRRSTREPESSPPREAGLAPREIVLELVEEAAARPWAATVAPTRTQPAATVAAAPVVTQHQPTRPPTPSARRSQLPGSSAAAGSLSQRRALSAVRASTCVASDAVVAKEELQLDLGVSELAFESLMDLKHRGVESMHLFCSSPNALGATEVERRVEAAFDALDHSSSLRVLRCTALPRPALKTLLFLLATGRGLLETLAIESSTLDSSACRSLGELFLQTSSQQQLSSLSLTSCALPSSGLRRLVHSLASSGYNGALRQLDLSHTVLDRPSVLALAQWVSGSSCSLQSLRVDHCELTASCLELLAAGVKSSATLRTLSLAGNVASGLGSCSAVLDSLSANCSLTALDLSANSGLICSASMVALQGFLGRHRTLRELRVGENGLSADEERRLVTQLHAKQQRRAERRRSNEFSNSTRPLSSRLQLSRAAPAVLTSSNFSQLTRFSEPTRPLSRNPSSSHASLMINDLVQLQRVDRVMISSGEPMPAILPARVALPPLSRPLVVKPSGFFVHAAGRPVLAKPLGRQLLAPIAKAVFAPTKLAAAPIATSANFRAC